VLSLDRMSTGDVRELIVRMGRARTLGLAAEMAFWLFFALIPLAVVVGLVAAKLAMSDETGKALLLVASLPRAARELLLNELGKVAAWKGGAVAPSAALVFLWLASSGVHAVFDAFEIQAGCARPWWKKRLIALGTCVVLSVGVGVVTLLGTGIDWLWHAAGSHVPEATKIVENSAVGQVVRFVLGAVISLGLTSLVFVLGVARGARRRMPVQPRPIHAVARPGTQGRFYRP
jgi:membrane protein